MPDLDISGATKLFVVHRARRSGATVPTCSRAIARWHAEGPAAEHVLAYARSEDLVVVGTRLPVGLEPRPVGGATTRCSLSAGEWTDVMTGSSVTGGPVELAELLDRYPVALLLKS